MKVGFVDFLHHDEHVIESFARYSQPLLLV